MGWPGQCLENTREEVPIQAPWHLQKEAIEDAVNGLGNHDLGRLVMACGTGKTSATLRIAEHLVKDGQRILFGVPTIALGSRPGANGNGRLHAS